mgnify:CR=1 FL=1
MTELKIGDKVTKIEVKTDGDKLFKLEALNGKNCVIYFYPKDDTPGCTIEAQDFSSFYTDFKDKNTEIIGISKDSIEKHDKFKAKYDLTITLGSDEDLEICKKIGVWVEKSMYGKKYMGVDRATFLLDSQGKILNIWRKVKVTGHVQEVLESI